MGQRACENIVQERRDAQELELDLSARIELGFWNYRAQYITTKPITLALPNKLLNI